MGFVEEANERAARDRAERARAAREAYKPAAQKPATAEEFVKSSASEGVVVMPVGSRGRPRFPSRMDGAEAGTVSGGSVKPTLG